MYEEHGKVVHGLFATKDDNNDDDKNKDDDDRGYTVGDEDRIVHLLGSTTEFKNDGSNVRIWHQMFANMASWKLTCI